MANTTAEYFGLKVDVLCVMKNCSLIRFESKEFIADTADLELGQILEQAA
jgi:hypothetical protein